MRNFFRNNLTFLECSSSYEDADICLFGAPFDSTASFVPGSRFAPQNMRQNSYGLETYSPRQDKDLTEMNIFDCGDIEVALGNTEKTLNAISDTFDRILSDNKTPVMIGGEHTVTLAGIRSAYKKYGDSLRVIHFDAHTDLRDEMYGVYLSHATVIRRAAELLGDKKIYQFGIRSGEKEEFLYGEKHNILHKFDLLTLDNVIEKLKEVNAPVYFTLDLDILDPSFFPGTGTIEPGGISFTELIEAVIKIGSNLNIAAFDMVELCPPNDQSGASCAVALKTLREFLLSIKK